MTTRFPHKRHPLWTLNLLCLCWYVCISNSEVSFQPFRRLSRTRERIGSLFVSLRISLAFTVGASRVSNSSIVSAGTGPSATLAGSGKGRRLSPSAFAFSSTAYCNKLGSRRLLVLYPRRCHCWDSSILVENVFEWLVIREYGECATIEVLVKFSHTEHNCKSLFVQVGVILLCFGKRSRSECNRSFGTIFHFVRQDCPNSKWWGVACKQELFVGIIMPLKIAGVSEPEVSIRLASWNATSCFS